MWTPQVFVRLADLPDKVRGVTVPNDDGTFDVYLNLRLSPERRQECLRHEIRHITLDHFYSDSDVETLERAADGLPEPEKTGDIPYFKSLDEMLTLFRSP